MRVPHIIAAAHVTFLMLGLYSLAAQPPKPSPLTPATLEDPELYFAFFRAHNALDQIIQGSTSATAAQLTNTNASLYNVSVADFVNLTAEVTKFMGNLSAWEVREQAYVKSQTALKKLPDVNTLVNYQYQRRRLVMDAHASIHAALSTSSWNGLYAYINGPFRTNVYRAAGGGK